MSDESTSDLTCTEYEVQEVEKANATGKQPVIFVHGLWLLPNSWDPWREVFEEAGYASVAPGWPDDPLTTEEAKEHPEVFARKSVGQVADHYEQVIQALERKPAVIGHSFGGLLTEILAGRGLAAASVAISPAPFRGVLPLPFSALKSASPVLRNPANRNRAVPLTYDQFKYAFANTVDDEEANRCRHLQWPRGRRGNSSQRRNSGRSDRSWEARRKRPRGGASERDRPMGADRPLLLRARARYRAWT